MIPFSDDYRRSAARPNNLFLRMWSRDPAWLVLPWSWVFVWFFSSIISSRYWEKILLRSKYKSLRNKYQFWEKYFLSKIFSYPFSSEQFLKIRLSSGRTNPGQLYAEGLVVGRLQRPPLRSPIQALSPGHFPCSPNLRKRPIQAEETRVEAQGGGNIKNENKNTELKKMISFFKVF